MKHPRILSFLLPPLLVLGGIGSQALAQSPGEYLEPTPEQRDTAFTAEDAAAEAALWSTDVIDRSSVDPLGEMVAAADLVISGKVVSQSYSYDATGIPFTHTTVAVTEVLAGEFSGAEFTVVQEGGPSRDDPRRAMMVSSSQHFTVGEEEVLFLSADGARGAGSRTQIDPDYTGPEKVDVQQRFRVYQGKLYDEDGHGVIVEPVARGSGHRLRLTHGRNPAKRFSEIRVGGIVLQKQFVDRAGEPEDSVTGGATAAGAARRAAPDYTAGSDVAALGAAIAN